jgi:Ca2+-binding RTX toxin-like protein
MGADQLHGGTGVDTISYHASSGVVIDLMTGFAGAGDAAGDKISGFENVSGSYSGDTLSGNSSANILDGYGGHDWLDGCGGNDTLIGYLGNDRFIYKLAATDDFVSVNIGGGLDAISDFKQGEDKLDISVDWNISYPNELHVSGQDVFEVLDSNNDNKLTGTDYWVDQTTLMMNGKASTALVLDIGAGVGEQLFGGAGEDTLALLEVTSLAKSDFVLA